MAKAEVFISYSWIEESETIAGELETIFQKKGLEIIRDKWELAYKGEIKKFILRKNARCFY